MPFYNRDNEEVLNKPSDRIPRSITWFAPQFLSFNFSYLIETSDGLGLMTKAGLPAKGFNVQPDKKSDTAAATKDIETIERVLVRKAKAAKLKNPHGSLFHEDGNHNIFVLFGKGFNFQYGDEDPFDVDTKSNLSVVFEKLREFKDKSYPVKFDLTINVSTSEWKGSLYKSFFLKTMKVIVHEPSPPSDYESIPSESESIPSEEEQDEESDDE